MEINRRTIGVNIDSEGNTSILLWAPHAKKAGIRLCKGRRDIPLQEADYGYWELQTNELKEGDKYKFILDDERFLPDPASLSQPDGVHEASEVFNPKSFNWTDSRWKNMQLEDYVIYELHTGTFSPEGTFDGIAAKLDYLKDLGITAIELMPVAQFPGSRNWGYDGVYPFAVQNTYGGPAGLQKLVDMCHKKGMAVILDVVYNHLGPEGNYFNEYGYYFTDKYHTPWGNAVNFDDAWCDAVRRFYVENALMWCRDFHIDALRLDAVHAMKDFSAHHILGEIRAGIDQLMKETDRHYYLIAECDLNDVRFINPLDKGGYGMDAQWVDEFHHALRVTAGGDRSGYYADFNGIEHLAKAYKDAYVYDGIYSPHRLKTFGNKAENTHGEQFVVFSQNHDQVGNRMLGERSNQLVSFEMQKLMAAAVLTAPFLPMLFMGEEYAEPHPFLYFVNHTDAELADLVRKGRKQEFAAFHIDGEAPDPVAEDTFETSRLQWDILDQEPHRSMLKYYKQLVLLRRHLSALKRPNRNQVKVECDVATQTLRLHRWYQSQYAIVLMNFSKQEHELHLPEIEKDWAKMLDSAAPEWGGPKAEADLLKSGSMVTIQPESVLIYTNQ